MLKFDANADTHVNTDVQFEWSLITQCDYVEHDPAKCYIQHLFPEFSFSLSMFCNYNFKNIVIHGKHCPEKVCVFDRNEHFC